MKEIVVISGKGGTGKTSLTGSFAVLAQNSVIADCDVDAADLHLLLNPQVIESNSFISGHEAVIDQQKCIECGECQRLCRFDAIDLIDGSYAIKPIGCEGCKVCVAFCPVEAISFPQSNCGDWFYSLTAHGEMVHARLKAGAENSGKLVSLVRSEAKEIAKRNSSDWIIVDGPPGIGCPVISSVGGVDAAVIVTEPTLSGKHDLERVLALAKHFSVPPFILINKCDLNEEICREIEALAESAKAPLLGKIPYSPIFNRAQQEGEPVVLHSPKSNEAVLIREIWKQVEMMIGTVNE